MKNKIKLIVAIILMGLFLSGTGYQTGLTELNLLIPKTPVLYVQIGGLGTVIQDAYNFIDKVGLSALVTSGMIETQLDGLLAEMASPLTYAMIDGSKPIALSMHELDLEQPQMALYIPIVSPSTNIPKIKAGLEETIGSDETGIFAKGSYLVIHTKTLKFNASSMNNAAYLSMYREGNLSFGMNMPEFMKYMKKEGLWDDVMNEMDSSDSPAMQSYMTYLLKILDEAKDLVFNTKADATAFEFSTDLSWQAGGTLDKIYASVKKGDLDRFMNYLPKNALFNMASTDSTFDQKEYYKVMKEMLSEILPEDEKEMKLIKDLLDKYLVLCSQMSGGSASTFDMGLDASKITADLFSQLESDDDAQQLAAAEKIVSAIKFSGLSVLKIKDKSAMQKALKDTLSSLQKAADSVKDDSGIKLAIVTPAAVKAGSISVEEIKITLDARDYMNKDGIKKTSVDKAQAVIDRCMNMLTTRIVFDGDLMFSAIGISPAELEKIVKNKKIDGPSVLEIPAIKTVFARNPVNVMFFQFQLTPLNNIASVFAPTIIKPIKDVYYPGIFSVAGMQEKVFKMDLLLTTDELKYYYSNYGQMITDYLLQMNSMGYDDENYEGDDYYDENDYTEPQYYDDESEESEE